jgi:Alginate export
MSPTEPEIKVSRGAMSARAVMTTASRIVLVALTFCLRAPAHAQSATPAAAQTEERPTGLPAGIDWEFNFDAGVGTFGFANSLYQNPRDGASADLSDQWFEGYAQPALSGRFRFASSSELYGKVSVVGQRTYGSAPGLYGPEVSTFAPEDAFIGWRSGKSIGSTENMLDFSAGRQQYRLGHGFLLMDGGAEGGSRGGYWSNAQKVFEVAAVGRVKHGPHAGHVFYLDPNELPESDSGTRLWGANYEWSAGERSTIGATYLKFDANPAAAPGRDGLDVFNVRSFASPIPRVPDLSFEVEYASERNGATLDSNAWTVLGAYQISRMAWKPKLSYRFASFEGDNPETPVNENFDPLLPGFYDWGTWWQGEIAGEYFLSNSNLISHQLRAHVAPGDAVSGGLILYNFQLDRPESFGAGVTARDVALEVDLYTDWNVNANVALSFIVAFADPGAALQQALGRTKNFSYGLVYVSYSF